MREGGLMKGTSEEGSCPADVATAARPRTGTHDYGRFYSYI